MFWSSNIEIVRDPSWFSLQLILGSLCLWDSLGVPACQWGKALRRSKSTTTPNPSPERCLTLMIGAFTWPSNRHLEMYWIYPRLPFGHETPYPIKIDYWYRGSTNPTWYACWFCPILNKPYLKLSFSGPEPCARRLCSSSTIKRFAMDLAMTTESGYLQCWVPPQKHDSRKWEHNHTFKNACFCCSKRGFRWPDNPMFRDGNTMKKRT